MKYFGVEYEENWRDSKKKYETYLFVAMKMIYLVNLNRYLPHTGVKFKGYFKTKKNFVQIFILLNGIVFSVNFE